MLRNGLRRHDLRLDATPPAAWGERFTLQGRFTQSLLDASGDWRRWSGTVHAALPRTDVSELRRHVTLPFEFTEGDGAVRAWLDVRDGQLQAVTADLALRAVTLRLGASVEPLAIAQLQGRVGAERDGAELRFTAAGLGFATADGVVWPRNNFTLALRQAAGVADGARPVGRRPGSCRPPGSRRDGAGGRARPARRGTGQAAGRAGTHGAGQRTQRPLGRRRSTRRRTTRPRPASSG